MKKLLLLCSLFVASIAVMKAQVTGITVETFYTDNGTVTGYPAGHSTYRIYANCTNPGDVVATVYGLATSPLTLSVPGGIWNSPNGGSTADNVSCALIGLAPLTQYDSYVTLSKTCDTDVAGTVRTAPTDVSEWLDPYFGTGSAVPYGPSTFQINSAVGSSWFAVPGLDANATAGSDLKVLIAQITTNGPVCGTFNLSVFPNYSGPNSLLLEQTNLTFGTVTCGTPGCTDPTAVNFNAAADYDNGLCLYPCALEFTTNTSTNPSCGGLNDGTITFEATGSQDIPSYTFNGGNPFISASAVTRTALGNGTYTITAEDPRFSNPLFNTDPDLTCTASIIVTLNTVALSVGSVTSSNITCAGLTDGCGSASFAGGTGSLSYSVVNNSNNQAVQSGLNAANYCGLAAGTYYLRATDENGCALNSATFTITAPIQLTLISGSSSSATCADSPNGTRVISWSGGTGDVDFSLDNDGTYEIEGTPNALITSVPGNFTIYAQDINGCTASLEFSVPGPAPIALDPTFTLPTCVGDADGGFTVAASGGNGGFTYSFNGGAFDNTVNYTDLEAGTYTVLVRDAQNCESTFEVTLNNPDAVGAGVQVQNISCNGQLDGTILLNGNGGTAPYSYSIDNTNFQTTGQFSGLAAGTYDVYVTDGNGCTYTAIGAAVVVEPAVLTASSSVSNISCFGLNDGVIGATPAGGTSPFGYSLNGGPQTANNSFDGLDVGNYTIVITDARGCTTEVSGSISEPAALSIVGLEADPIDATPGGSSPYNVTGGTTPYEYSWTNAQGSEVSGNQNLGPFNNPANQGSYTLTVTDANGCTVSQTIAITGIGELEQVVSVTATPNPTMGQFTLKMEGLKGDKVFYTITDTQGRVVLRKELGNAAGTRTEQLDIAAVAAGVYYIQLNSGSSNTTVKLIKQ